MTVVYRDYRSKDIHVSFRANDALISTLNDRTRKAGRYGECSPVPAPLGFAAEGVIRRKRAIRISSGIFRLSHQCTLGR
jgi:hypothetical protein